MVKTIQVPTEAGICTVEGKVAWLMVGDKRVKFFIHEDPQGRLALSHYASGYKLGDLNPIKIRNFRSYAQMTDRTAAEILIDNAVRINGAEKVLKVLKVMNEKPVLNHA